MLRLAGDLGTGLAHLFFPACCAGCGAALLAPRQAICVGCLADLPRTGYAAVAGNPIEKIFWGRVPVETAAAVFFFTQGSRLQRMLHALKYEGNRRVGEMLGLLMGEELQLSGRPGKIDAVVPVPLFRSRQRERGFNQAAILAAGVAKELGAPLLTQALRRSKTTATQTHKGRVERWQNMAGRFRVAEPGMPEGGHVLLVDDVITTGATLEACVQACLTVPGLRVSVACAAGAVSR